MIKNLMTLKDIIISLLNNNLKKSLIKSKMIFHTQIFKFKLDQQIKIQF